MTFSIIIPVYNAAKFLRPCLESVLEAVEKVERVEKVEKVEIICVDDGSTDGSAEILEEFQAKAKGEGQGEQWWIKVFSQANAGVSAARNRGLEAATGEWVCFVDADDTVEPDWLVNYIAAIEKYQPDLIRLNACTGEAEERCLVGEDAWNWAWTSWVEHGYVWTYAVRREIALKARFPAGVRCCEDSIYESQLTPFVKTAVQLKTSGYNYRTVEGSASLSRLPSAERVVALKTIVEIAKRGDIRLHPVTFPHAVWGAVIMWALRPKDTDHADEIYRLFKSLREAGCARLAAVHPRMKLPCFLYAMTGWLWPMKTYAAVISFLSRVKRALC